VNAGRRLPTPFWTLWAASAVSALGDGLRYVAFPLLAAGLSSDPRSVAFVFLAGYLPWPLFGLLGGAVVDRTDRRALMWRSDLLRAALVAGFSLLVLAQGGQIAALAGVSFVLGVVETGFDNAASAILPMVVPAPQLESANAWLQSVLTINATLVGGPFGAALYGLGHHVPFAVDAVTFAVAAALIRSLAGDFAPTPNVGAAHLGRDIAEGLGWLWRQPFLRSACLLLVVINGTLAAGEAVLVLFARQVLGLSDYGYTALLVTLALGAILGTLVAPRVRRQVGLPAVVVAAALCQAGALLAAGLSSRVTVAVAAMAVIGASSATWNVVTISYRQAVVPAALLGRVTSSYRVVGLSAMPLGAGAGGVIAHDYGLHAPFLLGGAVLVAATAASFRGLSAAGPPPAPGADHRESCGTVSRAAAGPARGPTPRRRGRPWSPAVHRSSSRRRRGSPPS